MVAPLESTEVPSPPLPAATLTLNEACAYAKVSRRTIYSWIAAGKLTVWRTAGGSVRVDPQELVRRESPEAPTR